jgi:hypothetical protein
LHDKQTVRLAISRFRIALMGSGSYPLTGNRWRDKNFKISADDLTIP